MTERRAADPGDQDEREVFLCDAWEDKPQADALREAMERAGLTVFQDDADTCATAAGSAAGA